MYDDDNIKNRKKNEYEKELERSMRDGKYFYF
jgi:hypothetical protein